MSELLWCALAGLVAGALVSAPVWLWAMARERARDQEWRRRARQDWLAAHPEDDAPSLCA